MQLEKSNRLSIGVRIRTLHAEVPLGLPVPRGLESYLLLAVVGVAHGFGPRTNQMIPMKAAATRNASVTWTSTLVSLPLEQDVMFGDVCVLSLLV